MRSSRQGISFLATVLILLPSTLNAQSALAEAQAPARYGPAIELARTLIEAVMEASGTPGMSVAVGVDGEIVWAEGFGYADAENRVAVWEETKFRVGSVSKPITAAAVGLLVEQGKLDLDARIQRYVPGFPVKRWPISTRQVAGHLAGIRHYDGDEFLSSVRYESVSDGLEIFQADSLLFEPGTRFSYSSYGWNLVSAVIEGASGEDFLPFMQRHVFNAIGMEHTVADYTDSIIPHRTRFYERGRDGQVRNAVYVDNSYKWAGGGFLSTPSDLVRFGFAHFGGEFLQPETIAELWTPQTTNDGESTGYAIGWFVSLEDGVVVRAGHGGGSVGGTTGFATWPPEQAVVALAGNMSQAPTGGLIVTMIADAFLDPSSVVSSGIGPELAGEYECVVSDGEETLASATMTVGDSPSGYWGRITWDNDSVDRVIHSTSSPDGVGLLTVDERGIVSHLEFTEIGGPRLGGTARSGGLEGAIDCTRP